MSNVRGILSGSSMGLVLRSLKKSSKLDSIDGRS
jgi:hypothetical protein